MQLKRYVLLDNNKIYDKTKLDETNYIITGVIRKIENDDTYNLCRQLVATSDEAPEFAVKGDLIEDEDGNIVTVKGNDIERGIIMLPGFLETVKYRFVYKLYKKIYKDYICVWEREESE